MAVQPWFRATERFDPSAGSHWASYVAWSGLTQLDELVSLDSLLCPDVINTFDDEYWMHRPVEPDTLYGWIVTDLSCLLRKLEGHKSSNVLGLFLEPREHGLEEAEGLRFDFLGYDLVECGGGISALTTCRGFPEAFANEELSAKGLLTSMERARQVQTLLRQHYPNEAHADCELWAIYRAT